MTGILGPISLNSLNTKPNIPSTFMPLFDEESLPPSPGVREAPLLKIMQVLQFRYTRYFNKRYRKVGHLFQGRYKAILCDKETYLLELIRYIHLNPLHAGMAGDPEEYPWTGHMGYLSKGKEDLIDADLV
jgi:putative transposase